MESNNQITEGEEGGAHANAAAASIEDYVEYVENEVPANEVSFGWF